MSERGINTQPVAFLDSGIGGLPYSLWVREHLKHESVIYLADHKHFPYGTKTAGEIETIVLKQAEKLIERDNPKLLVLACNSATVHALDYLRNRLSIPIVGVVPAIKPAVKESKAAVIGIWATEATVHSEYMQGLIDRFAQNTRIVRQAETELVARIETHILDYTPEQWILFLTPQIEKLQGQGVDRLVLGCTHFTYLSDYVESISKGAVIPVDSRMGVGNQIQRVLQESQGLSNQKNPLYRFYTSLEKEDRFYQRLAEKYQFQYGGVI